METLIYVLYRVGIVLMLYLSYRYFLFYRRESKTHIDSALHDADNQSRSVDSTTFDQVRLDRAASARTDDYYRGYAAAKFLYNQHYGDDDDFDDARGLYLGTDPGPNAYDAYERYIG